MDNAQKAIMIGVGLFITIIIISVVLLITNLGTGMVDDARESLGNMSASMQNTLKSSYDNKNVTGADVAGLYTQYKNDANFLLVIQTGATEYYSKDAVKIKSISGTNYYEKDTSGSISASTWASVSVTNKISSSDSYHTYLIKDGDTVLGVYCAKQ